MPRLCCPDPACEGALLRGHGGYQRYVDGVRMWVRRGRCARCRVTHAIVPEDLCAYRDLSLATLETALKTPGGPTARARAAGQPGAVGVRRVRRWLRAAEAMATALQGLLPAAAGAWWERAQRVFGAAPGWLVRLRRWLVSRWGYFFGGLGALLRHGRPSRLVRGAST